MAEPTVAERWLPVVGYEGVYSVSDQGRVRRERAFKGVWSGRLLRTQPAHKRGGYPMLELWKDNARTRVYLHRLVALAFLGPPPPVHEVNHKNGVVSDNRVENLEWVTHTENAQHAVRVLKHGRMKLNEDQVIRIRFLAESGSTTLWIAEHFGMSAGAIHSIVTRRTWPHI